MSNNASVYILNHLSSEGFAVNAMDSKQSHVAWYLHVLLGLGVSVTSLCFALLLGVLDFFDLNHSAQAVFGIIFIGIAVLLYRSVIASTTHENVATALATQVSLVLMLTGKYLVIANICEYFEIRHIVIFALVTSVVVAATLPLYRVKLDHVISIAAILWLWLMTCSQSIIVGHIFITVFFLLLLLGLVMVSLRCSVYRYLRYAPVIVVTAYLNIFHNNFLDLRSYAGLPAGVLYPSIIIACALIVCVIKLAPSWKENYVLWALTLVLVGLAFVMPATIFFAVLLMVLGYGSRDSVMLGLGTLLLPYHLFEFYYNLQVSLLNKSFLLAGSGLILLAVAAIAYTLDKRQQLTQRENKL